MKINLIFYLSAVVFVANFATAKNEQKRRRPIVDTSVPEASDTFEDQIALDSINYQSKSHSFIDPSENYPPNFFAVAEQIKKKSNKQATTEQKTQYVTPETYSAPPRIKEAFPSSYSTYTYLNRSSESKRPTRPKQKQKVQSDYSDYNFYFPESKRINTKTPAKASTSQDSYEKFYQPQSADAVVHKEVTKNGDELTYHYYYPSEESSHVDQKPSFPSSTVTPSAIPSSTYSPSSTVSPSYTRHPSLKQSTKKKAPTTFHHTIEHTSTDPYQYPPVLQRPNDFDINGSEAPDNKFYPTFGHTKIHKTQSTLAPSTATSIKMLKPTKKNNYYLPSSTTTPVASVKPIKIRRPSAETSSFGKFSLPPSISTTTTIAPHYSTTTRSPDLYKYSTVSPISSTTLSDFYIKASSQVTPTVTSLSSSDLHSDSSSERTVVIKPKLQYTAETYDQQPTEKIVYKYVSPEEYYGFEANKTETYTPSYNSYDFETAKTPDYYRNLNLSTQADMDFSNSFHKNYNYQYFTEEDAKNLQDTGESKIDRHISESDIIDDKQRASKKNMVFAISPEPRYPASSIIPVNVQDHEVPPPMTENDNELTPEASKNQQYFVLYSVDDDNRRERKPKKKVKPQEPEIVLHHHQHQHHENEKEYDEEFQQFDNEFDSEFDSDLVNSDNVRIVDPSVRGGRPIEFTKDDYLRHIKQAVVQYMRSVQHPLKDSSASSSTSKVKKYHDVNQDSISRPTKSSLSASILSSTAGYKSSLAPHQYKQMAPLKLPKNIYTADKLKDAIDGMQDAPPVDLTLKKAKFKPFDLSAIDVGQTYQHVTQFDHSAALKNVEEFDTSHAMTNSNRQKLHFSQQTYHDINNLGHNNHHKQKLSDDNDNDNAFKSFALSNKYGGKLVNNQNTFSAMSYDASKLPRIVNQNNDDDEDENKVDDTIDAPIQIINGIPVANPYNIDLNTLKYMLGGIAQAEVNDQIKDLDESSAQKFANNWKAFSPVGSFTSNNPIYQVYGHQKGNENAAQKQPKKTQSNSNKQQQQQQNRFPLVGTLVNFQKMKNGQQNKQKSNSNNNSNNNSIKSAINIHDYSNWNQINKKQRSEPQVSSSQNVFVIRPAIRNKQARDDRKASLNRLREPSREIRPPPPLKPKQAPHLLLARIK